MSIDKSKETESQVSEITKTSVRRNFLKKSAIGLVASSMPAQSVWGACNASGISGGSTSTTTCVMPVLSNGRSPGSWVKFIAPQPTDKGRNKIKAMFSAYKTASDGALNHNFCYLNSYIKNTTIMLSDGKGSIPYKELHLGNALANPGGIWNLAAVYLNARFGFYNIPPEFSGADELIEHIWGVLYVTNNNMEPTNFDSLESSFNDGVTHMSIPQNGSCS
ncbi:MAG: hypothetical protein ACI9O6_000067 [Glaciecola sp.]|jgi:hypothetical protein